MPVPAGITKSTEPTGGEKGTALQQAVFGGAPGKTQAQGVKRTREEESEKEEEEDSEEEAEMEMDESD
jgi:hypothetical protein